MCEEKKYIRDYIDQLNKSIELYNSAYSVVYNINNFNRHFPIDWDRDDVFGLLDYLYDYNYNAEVQRIIKKKFNDLFNNFIKNKLEETKNNYQKCVDILGTDKLYEYNSISTNINSTNESNYDEISISSIITHIEYCIDAQSYNNLVHKYINYTDDDIKIIKDYILKIRNELCDIAKKLELPDKKDWELY